MPDPLGYRLKIGSVLASTNACVEPEFAAMSVPGVTHLSARARVREQAGEDDTTSIDRELFAALERLDDAKPDLVIVALPAICVARHAETPDSLRESLSRATAAPLLFVEDALRDALRRHGATRVGISSPYPASLDQRIKAWFETAGFDVAAGPDERADSNEDQSCYSLYSGLLPPV